MRVILQKVARAAVKIDGITVGQCGRGYLLFLGCIMEDLPGQAQWLAAKIVKLRLFAGEDGTVNPTSPRPAGLRRTGDRSLLDIGGEILVVSQFTLAGQTEKGNRPDYTRALPPGEAKPLYEYFVEQLRALGVKSVQTGKFGAMMEVELVNDGPVTLLLER